MEHVQGLDPQEEGEMNIFPRKKTEGMATTSAAVDDLVEWLKGNLRTLNYGEIGLSFTVHDGKVSRHRKILEVIEKPGECRT